MSDDKRNTEPREDRRESEPTPTAGQAFVKMIGPFGSALFLLAFALFLIFCFTGGNGLG